MPELPEVETVRQTLRQRILGKTIAGVEVFYPKMIQGNVEEFTTKLKDKTIIEIYRLGKYLYFELSDSIFLISHLRMEGKYFIKPKEMPKEKHEHVIFHFTDGVDLRYHDTRKFGTMELKTNENLLTTHPLSDLGKEAYLLDASYLKQKIGQKHTPLKEFLLNQEMIAGIGNIYADEICFLSRLHPQEDIQKLRKKDLEALAKNSKEVMEKAIAAGGTTIRSYTSSLGVTGLFQLELHVHTKEGLPCPNCGRTIQKIRVGGRGTYYCTRCQKMKK